MNRRLVTHYRGICKNIETGQKKIIEPEPEPEKEPEKEPIIDLPIIDLQEIQNSELKNTDLQPDFFNYTVVRKFPLLITAEDFEKGLENKTEFFNHSDENPKKIQILIKIKKYIVHK